MNNLNAGLINHKTSTCRKHNANECQLGSAWGGGFLNVTSSAGRRLSFAPRRLLAGADMLHDTGRAAIDRAAGPTAANPPHAAIYSRRMGRAPDGHLTVI